MLGMIEANTVMQIAEQALRYQRGMDPRAAQALEILRTLAQSASEEPGAKNATYVHLWENELGTAVYCTGPYEDLQSALNEITGHPDAGARDGYVGTLAESGMIDLSAMACELERG